MKIRSLLAILLCLALALSAVACADTTGAASSTGGSSVSVSSKTALSGDASESAASAQSKGTASAVSEAASDASEASSVPEIPKDYTRRTVLLTSDPSLWRITGRSYEVNAADGRKAMCFDMGGMGFHFTADCEGDVSLKISMKVNPKKDSDGKDMEGQDYLHFLVRVDGEGTDVTLNGSKSETVRTLPLATGLTRGRHIFEVYRCNEGYRGIASLVAVELGGWLETYQMPRRDLKMVFLGDSITVGLGINAQNQAADQQFNSMHDATKSYAFITGEKLNADFSMVAIGGMNCSTYAGDGSSCYNFYNNYSYLRNPKVPYDNTAETDVDVYVISLGTNDTNKDGSGKYYNSNETLTTYVTALVQRVRADHPNAKIVWTYGQLHGDLASVFKNAIEALKATDSNLYYFRYKTANTSGGNYHPSAAAQAKQAEELIAFLRENVM